MSPRVYSTRCRLVERNPHGVTLGKYIMKRHPERYLNAGTWTVHYCRHMEQYSTADTCRVTPLKAHGPGNPVTLVGRGTPMQAHVEVH